MSAIGHIRPRIVLLLTVLIALILFLVWNSWPEERTVAGAAADFSREEGLAGGVVAEGMAGQAPHIVAFGRTSTDPQRTVVGTDRFRIASLSKPVTAAAVIEAARRNDIALARPVSETVPAIAEAVDERFAGITHIDLLRHSGGWDRSETDDPFFLSSEKRAQFFGMDTADDVPTTCSEIALASRTLPLQFAPGSRYAYSNIGYCWLALWLEQVTGESYVDAVHDLVPESRTFTMTEELGDVRPSVDEAEALYPAVDPAAIGPAGGWTSDAAAYFRFASRPLDPVQRERPPYAGRDEYYGLGWRFWNIDGTRYRTHYGALPGVFSVVIVRGDGRMAVILFDGMPADYEAGFDDLFARVRAATDW